MPTTAVASSDDEVKFQSAVALVRSLPQKGPFQPSYGEASKVYGYYKQAQCGPCKQSKPAFWDVVGRAKWDAWTTLDQMPKREAMTKYVDEIKKLFQRLTTMAEFQETQKEFSYAIIPFCESNGIELPVEILENEKNRKKKKEKKKITDSAKSNGIGKTHGKELDEGFDDSIATLNGNDIEISTNAISKSPARNGSLDLSCTNLCNGEAKHEEGGNGTEFITDANINDANINAQNAVQFPVIKMDKKGFYVDAESSDDDIFCDSINPDEVSFVGEFQTSASSQIDSPEKPSELEDDLVNIAVSSSLLNAESQCIRNDSCGEIINIHSTPSAMKPIMAQNVVNELHSNKGGNHTDNSTSSSLLAAENGRHIDTVSTQKTVAGGLEDELKHEFEMPLQKPGKRRLARNRRGNREGSRHYRDGHGKRDLVISARGGNSQTDLAGNRRGGDNDGNASENNPTEVEPTRPQSQETSQRPRGTRKDSSTDSTDSMRSSNIPGETIGEQIVKSLGKLEEEMRLVLLQLNSIENRIRTVGETVNRRPWWANFIPSRRLIFFVIWPVVINILLAYWRRRRRK